MKSACRAASLSGEAVSPRPAVVWPAMEQPGGNRLRASTLAACGPDAGDIPLPGQFGEVLGASSSSMNGGPALPSLAAVCYIGN